MGLALPGFPGKCLHNFKSVFSFNLKGAIVLLRLFGYCRLSLLLLPPTVSIMPPIESPQLRFLSDAAQFLGSRSPSTSAHLLDAHTRVLHNDHKSLSGRQQKHHCGACGSLRKLSTLIYVKPRRKSALGSGAKVYKCLRCHQRTVIPSRKTVPKRAPAPATPALSIAASTPSTGTATSQAPSQPSTQPQPTKAEDNAGSKKRAKARKQGGLQALLASKKSAQPSLDLLDFLQ